MARITMTIEAVSAADLQDTIELLSGHSTFDQVGYVEFPPKDEPDAGARQDAEPGERQASATKFRRTQDEIARGLTVEQAKAERSGATSKSTSETNSAPETSTAGSPAAAGESVDPFAEATKSASQPTSDASPGTTLEAVKKAMQAYLDTDGNQAAGMLPIFAQFKTAEGDACARASQLQPADYAAFIEALAA